MIFNWPTPNVATLPQLGTPGIVWPDLGSGPAPPVASTTTGTGEKEQEEWNQRYLAHKRRLEREEEDELAAVVLALSHLGIFD